MSLGLIFAFFTAFVSGRLGPEDRVNPCTRCLGLIDAGRFGIRSQRLAATAYCRR